MSELSTILTNIIKKLLPKPIRSGKVVAVNMDNFTCDVDPNDGGAELQDIKLRPVVDDSKLGLILIPAVGSEVKVCQSDNLEHSMFLIQYGEIEQVLFEHKSGTTIKIDKEGSVLLNGDSFGGIVKAKELQSQLNKTNQKLDAMFKIINGTPIPEPGSGSPSAFQTALKAATSSLQLGKYNEIENLKIKHG